MTPEEIQALETLKASMQEATKGFAKQDEVNTLIENAKAELSGASVEALKKLEDIVASQGTIINELKAKPSTPEATKTVGEQMTEILEKNQDAFKAFVNKSTPFKFELKAAGTMTIGTNVTGSTTLLPTPQLIPGYNPYRHNAAVFWDYANVQQTGSARIAYVDEVSPDGAAATTAEGAAKPAIDKDDKVSVSNAIKVAANLKISDEMLDDIPFMSAQVNDNLTTRVKLAVSGNIYTYITANAALTAVSATMADMGGAAANMWQLIVAAQQTIAKSNYNCTHIFLNPTDYARLLLTKGDAQNPIIISATSMSVNGVIIVSANAVTVDKYIACDLSKLNVYEYKALSVEMGWENDDFTKNLRTFVGETRVHYFIKDNDKYGFLYGDITDDLLTLTV